MKKTMKYFSIAALALVGAIMTSCSNSSDFEEIPPQTQQQPASGDKVVTLTTTVSLAGGETRALTPEGVKNFAVGETMAIYYRSNSGSDLKAMSEPLTAGDIDATGKNATFTFTLIAPNKSIGVIYYYPAAMAKDNGYPNYEALYTEQDGTLSKLASKFDYCWDAGVEWDGENLPSATLDNVLAILAITLKNSEGSNDITSTITGMTISDGTDTYNITRSAAAGPIYVAINPMNGTTIDVTATDGTKFYTKTLTNRYYEASNGYPVSWKMNALPEGALPGKFTVNNSGDKMRFSKGNLRAKYYQSAWLWEFAPTQWSYVGDGSANVNITGNGTVGVEGFYVDLFGWVGNSSSWTGTAQYGISNATTTNSTSTYGNVANENLKSDWGNTIGSGWRTLTKDEWNYIFRTRTSGGSVGSTSHACYVHATINTDATGVNGIILFPDGINFAASEFTTLGTVNATTGNWGTKCTSAQWTALATKGCVFLPTAGYRNGATVGSVGSDGNYWSSSPYSVSSSYHVSFGSTYLDPQEYQNDRSRGYSVRLVRAVE